MAERRTFGFNKKDLQNVPSDKPGTYKILNNKGENIYTGSAKRERMAERIAEHLSSGPDPVPGGKRIQIDQKSSIAEAQKTEQNIISLKERCRPVAPIDSSETNTSRPIP